MSIIVSTTCPARAISHAQGSRERQDSLCQPVVLSGQAAKLSAVSRARVSDVDGGCKGPNLANQQRGQNFGSAQRDCTLGRTLKFDGRQISSLLGLLPSGGPWAS